MTTSVVEPLRVTAARGGGFARTLAFDATVPVVLFASAAIVIGLHWDIAWHRAIGRDTFWSPPHVLEQVAATLAGLFCGWRVIYTSFLGTDEDRASAVRFWRWFYGPLGGWVCIWGTIAMIASAPFDDWWHSAYGLDVEILTPPHVFLLLGMVTVQLGAMLMMLAEQNREPSSANRARGLLFASSMGLIVLMMTTMTFEYTGVPNMHRSPLFYQISALLLPLFLVAVSRAGRLQYPATAAAVTYSLVLMGLNWVLALVPATPMLAPIWNPVTTLIPPGFPILLVVPALAIDLVVRRTKLRFGLATAVVAGGSFVALLVLVQWPFSGFLLSLEQPNYFFGIGYWDYTERLGPWTTVFFDVPGYRWVDGREMVGSLDVPRMLQALGVAALFGMASSGLGLWWGRWMTRVQR
ncbi:MAG: hypothetical protein ACT4P7_13315 [Gemmatimonadaceae bacterium]